MKTARVLGIDLEALECLGANVTGVLDSRLRTLRQRVFPQGPGEMKVALGVTRIGFNRAPRVQLGVLEIKTARFVVTLVRSQVDSRPRRLLEGFVGLGIFLHRGF